MDAAKGNVKKEVQKEISGGQLASAISRAKMTFQKFGISTGAVESRIGKPIAKWGANELSEVRAILTSIKDGVTTAEQEFPAAAGTKESIEKALKAKSKPRAEKAPAAPKTTPTTADEEPPPADEPPPDFA